MTISTAALDFGEFLAEKGVCTLPQTVIDACAAIGTDTCTGTATGADAGKICDLEMSTDRCGMKAMID